MPTAKDPTVLMNVVAPEEPEGYRGRRRHFRFPFMRKAGGAAVPVLLVAASVVVVLIVVGVSQLLPKQAAGQIPFGSAPGTVSDNNGQGTDGDGGGSNGSDPATSPGATPKPGKPGAGKPSGSGTTGPGQPGGPAPSDTSTTATPTPTPTPTPTFKTVSVEAESATLGGAARTGSCTACSGGTKVRFIGTNTGWVTFNVTVPAAMKIQVTYYYVVATTSRTMYIKSNSDTPVMRTPALTPDWNTARPDMVTLDLKAGVNSIEFYNPNSGANAPDLDKVSFSAP